MASSAQCTSSTTSTAGPPEPLSSANTASNTASRSAPAATAAANGPDVPRAASCSGPNERGAIRSSQAPRSTRVRAGNAASAVLTRVVLPMPASPDTSATPPRPSAAAAKSCDRAASSASRSSSPIAAQNRTVAKLAIWVKPTFS